MFFLLLRLLKFGLMFYRFRFINKTMLFLFFLIIIRFLKYSITRSYFDKGKTFQLDWFSWMSGCSCGDIRMFTFWLTANAMKVVGIHNTRTNILCHAFSKYRNDQFAPPSKHPRQSKSCLIKQYILYINLIWHTIYQ